MLGILIFLLLILAAWGIKFVPPYKQWQPILFGARLPYRLTEGVVWLPRWLFKYKEYPITEDQIIVLRDDQPAGRTQETIMTNNGVMAIIKNVSAFWYIKRSDDQPFSGWRKILRYIGWKPGQSLYNYTQIQDHIFTERVIQITLQELRKIIQTYPFQQLLGLILEGFESPSIDRETIIQTRSELNEKLKIAVNKETSQWGVEIRSILVGDIDPDETIKKAVEERNQALGHKQQTLVRMSADLERVKQVFELTKEEPTLENIVKVYATIRGLDNNRISAEQLGLLGDVLRNWAGKPSQPLINTLSAA